MDRPGRHSGRADPAAGVFPGLGCEADAQAGDGAPFVHAVEMERALFEGNFADAFSHSLPVLIYGAAVTFFAVVCFLGQMKKQ